MEATIKGEGRIIFTLNQMEKILGFPRRKLQADAKSSDFSSFGFENNGRYYFNLPKYESYLERRQDDLEAERAMRLGRRV